MYNSVQNAHVNGLCHDSFFWTLSCGCFFQKLIFHISNTLQIYPISFIPVLYNLYLCLPT